MGQYYRVLLENDFGKKKIFQPSGLKQLEHGYYGTDAMARVERLLYREGARVSRIGDYSEIADKVWNAKKFEDQDEELYKKGDLLDQKEGFEYYLVNEDKKEFINMKKQRQNKKLQDQCGRVIHPLAILCRAKGDFGGGDYRKGLNIDKQGIWCGDKISVRDFPGEIDDKLVECGYKDKTEEYKFKEGF